MESSLPMRPECNFKSKNQLVKTRSQKIRIQRLFKGQIEIPIHHKKTQTNKEEKKINFHNQIKDI